MGGKHMKKLRAEKSKVQLKKKKLPKGQNVTDTSFKVKKILTVEQLKKVDDNEPVSNWNVPLKDLLNRLSHYNCTTRINSLTGIREILKKSTEVLLGPSLKPLITRLLERLTDEEQKVRLMAMNLLSDILAAISQDMRTPFFDIIIAYLSCAMTHRNASIQKDSLKFVEIVVQHYHGAFKKKLRTLMPSFLRILKDFLHGSQTQVLSSSVGPKQELEKTKTKMLMRFYQFLEACYSDDTIKEPHLINSDINVLEKQKISLRECCDLYKTIPDLSEVFKSSANKENIMKKSDSEDLWLLFTVMPLLFDTWKEFAPNPRKNEISSECVLTEAVEELLCVLLKLMLLINEKIMAAKDPSDMKHWFVLQFFRTFEKSFTKNFPYFPSVSRKRSRPSDEMTDTPTRESNSMCMEQNLIICYLSYSFKLAWGRSDLHNRIEDYISNALSKKNPTEVDILSRVVEAAVNASKSNVKGVESKVLNMAVAAHGKTKNPGLRQSLSKVLTKVALEGSEDLGQKGETFKNWIAHLPHLLCQPQISLHEVETILKLIIKPSGREVLREVEARAEDIAKNLENIKVEGVGALEGQRMIANILYRCREDVLIAIQNQVLFSEAYSESLRSYMLEIFNQKLGRQLNLF